MAKRPSVKEILELARQGGAAKPGEETAAEAAAPAPVESAAAAPEPVVPAAPAVEVPTAAKLGRPLTLAEKLAAARAGGTPAAKAPAAAAVTPAAAPAEAAPEGARSVPPPAPSLGRPLTLAEKLAAAKSGGATAATAAGGAVKPAAAKPAPVAKTAAVARELPPLDKITNPKDLGEALRQAGAKKTKEIETAKAKDAPSGGRPAKEKESKPQSVLPRPSRESVRAAANYTRRAIFSVTGLIVLGWVTFTLGMAMLTEMCVRFMFPNVLAEPPSTVKVGPASNFDPEAVNERFKAEWGFWIVRSTRYNGTDIIYAVQSVCTHLGCPPNWLAGEQKFKCPCHGSGFYISGINFEGPAPRPLERFKITTSDDGQLVVDKSQKFQEELGQWSDPDSYIQA